MNFQEAWDSISTNSNEAWHKLVRFFEEAVTEPVQIAFHPFDLMTFYVTFDPDTISGKFSIALVVIVLILAAICEIKKWIKWIREDHIP